MNVHVPVSERTRLLPAKRTSKVPVRVPPAANTVRVPRALVAVARSCATKTAGPGMRPGDGADDSQDAVASEAQLRAQEAAGHVPNAGPTKRNGRLPGRSVQRSAQPQGPDRVRGGHECAPGQRAPRPGEPAGRARDVSGDAEADEVALQANGHLHGCRQTPGRAYDCCGAPVTTRRASEGRQQPPPPSAGSVTVPAHCSPSLVVPI